jgi:hypothetical protein
VELCDEKSQLNKRRFFFYPVAFAMEYPMPINLRPQATIHHVKSAGDLHSSVPVSDKISATTPRTDKNNATEGPGKREPFPPLSPDIQAKVAALQPASVEASSGQLTALHEKIAHLENQVATLTSRPAASTATGQLSAGAPSSAGAPGKLKKMADAVKKAFANAPWEKIGKGALYATVAVTAFAVLSNPIGAISAVGMLLGSSLLPTAIGLAGAGYAVHKTHQWLNKKPDQDGPPRSAAASHHGGSSFSQSLENRA